MQAVSRTNLFKVGLFFLFLYLLQSYVAVLEFDRQQILAGQVWRLWTGHLVHSHLTHLALNGITAVALYFVFMTRIQATELLLCAFLFTFVISIILLCQYPSLAWYNGLSGLLHAVVAYLCLRFAGAHNKLYWLGFVFAWIKVVHEMLAMQKGYQGELAGMTIIIQAHFVGVCVGTLSALVYVLVQRAISQSTKVAL